MSFFQFLVIIGFCICVICPFDMNHSFEDFDITKYASDLFIGMSTSWFPGSSMLNFLLYGHSDIGYGYNDYLQHYGVSVLKFESGNIIIGNDSNLGGIIGSNPNNVIIPIPSQTIQSIPKDQLGKYFSKGYTIKRNSPIYNLNFYGKGFGNFSGFICNGCDTSISNFADPYDYDVFYLNNPFKFELTNSTSSLKYLLAGFLSSFDASTKKGSIKISVLGQLMTSYDYQYYLGSFSSNNNIDFYLDARKNFVYNGSIKIASASPMFFNLSGTIAHFPTTQYQKN